MTKIIVTCRVCKESGEGQIEGGKVSHLHITHERWCSFFQAVSLGPTHAEIWIKNNGYPMEFKKENGDPLETERL